MRSRSLLLRPLLLRHQRLVPVRFRRGRRQESQLSPCHSTFQSESSSRPNRKFVQTKPVYRSVQPSWFTKWPWLHYDQADCHNCVEACKKGIAMQGGMKKDSFIHHVLLICSKTKKILCKLYRRVETQTTNQRQCDHGRWPAANVGQQHQKGPDRFVTQ